MNKVALLLMALVVVGIMMASKEKYIPAEVFGFAGHTKPRTGSVVLNDAPVGKDSYQEVEASVDNDIMNELVTTTNDEVAKRTGMCTHVIETTHLKKFQDKSGNTLYEVMFMMKKHGGFSYGFSVVSSMFWKNGKAVLPPSAPNPWRWSLRRTSRRSPVRPTGRSSSISISSTNLGTSPKMSYFRLKTKMRKH